MAAPLRVLILEDRPSDVELMLRELRATGFDPEWTRVDSEEDYLAHLEPDIHIILADFHLPQFDALRALALLREWALDIPFIIVSGIIGEDIAVSAIKEGAADYLHKDRLARLGPAVQHALAEKRLRAERNRAEQALRESEERYRTVVESVDDCIVVADCEGRILAANSAAVARMGLPRDSYIGKTLMELLPPELTCQAIETDALVLRTGAAVEVEMKIPTPQGARIEHLRKAPVRNEGGAVVGVVTVGRDITERKRGEEALQKLAVELGGRNSELTRFNRIAVGREQRMIELKQEVNALSRQLGLPPPYPLGFLTEDRTRNRPR